MNISMINAFLDFYNCKINENIDSIEIIQEFCFKNDLDPLLFGEEISQIKEVKDLIFQDLKERSVFSKEFIEEYKWQLLRWMMSSHSRM